MSTSLYILIGAFLCYPFLAGFILRKSRSYRMGFAESATNLLQSPEISENHKVLISYMSDDVFDWRFMARAIIVFPKLVFTRQVETDFTDDDKKFFNREDVQELVEYHKKCVMAASPFFTALFFIVAIITITFIVFFFSISLISTVWNDTVKQVSPIVGSNMATIKQSTN